MSLVQIRVHAVGKLTPLFGRHLVPALDELSVVTLANLRPTHRKRSARLPPRRRGVGVLLGRSFGTSTPCDIRRTLGIRRAIRSLRTAPGDI